MGIWVFLTIMTMYKVLTSNKNCLHNYRATFPGFQSDNCDIELDNLGRVESQVVAGTNYRVTFSLKSTCAIPGGSNRIAITCEEVVVHMPLEFRCQNPNWQNPKCMDMSERMEENCSVSLQ